MSNHGWLYDNMITPQSITQQLLQLLSPLLSFFNCPWLFGSGKFSLGTRCITVVLPIGSCKAPNVTLPWRNLPWYINLRMFAGGSGSSSQSVGQLQYTSSVISAADSLGVNRNSLDFPLTKISRKLILSPGIPLDPIVVRDIQSSMYDPDCQGQLIGWGWEQLCHDRPHFESKSWWCDNTLFVEMKSSLNLNNSTHLKVPQGLLFSKKRKKSSIKINDNIPRKLLWRR